ncbi:MAG TPA: aminotransferase class I/II-fold pyridoxal phosphate-dependent enzyme [Clostridia bacterium]|nr:aminotransferase class I/II-fold pyridoxal phosphate-dependent enzyme [Clostridia bacterium]
MSRYSMNTEQKALLERELQRFEQFKTMGLKLDMSRGKPCKEQLDLSMGLFDVLTSKSNLIINKNDYRNYGILSGIPEIKAIFCELTGYADEEMVVAGNSSLNLMYDTLQRAMQFGVAGGEPLNKQGRIKWLCPVPGYDRHFAITELMGIEMINVPMTDEGPDVAVIEELVKDPAVKGMWCVPKYSNPQGIVYSDRAVKALASLKPAASDFRIYWDNAYMVHAITDEDDELTDILTEAKKAGNPDIVYIFGSTSKITFAGGGVAFVASSKRNIDDILSKMTFQTIGPDKISQLAHALFFKNADGIRDIMAKHKDILAPKFETVLKILEEELSDIAVWQKPRGGYFISVDLPNGTAKRTVALAKEAGVIFTPAGATFPYRKDPKDSNLRIAPSLPPIGELETAMRVFCCAAKIAYLEKQ